jgi:hypothetical protein
MLHQTPGAALSLALLVQPRRDAATTDRPRHLSTARLLWSQRNRVAKYSIQPISVAPRSLSRRHFDRIDQAKLVAKWLKSVMTAPGNGGFTGEPNTSNG